MDEKSKISVLIVEDDKYMNETLCEILESEGYNVSAAESVTEAISKLKNTKKQYRLLILDYNLLNHNGVTGIDIYNAAKEMYPNIKSIMMSAYGNKRIKERAYEKGINLFMDKPFRINELYDALYKVTH